MDLISEKLYKEIERYCILNKIEDIPNEINNILQVGFNVVRFGMSPFQKPQAQEEVKVMEEEKALPKKRGRKPKVIKEEIQNVEIDKTGVVSEQPKKKVRIIKNK